MGGEGRPDGSPFLLRCFGVSCSYSFTPRWEQLQGTALGPPHGKERGPRPSHPKGQHEPPQLSQTAPTPHSPGQGAA